MSGLKLFGAIRKSTTYGTWNFGARARAKIVHFLPLSLALDNTSGRADECAVNEHDLGKLINNL